MQLLRTDKKLTPSWDLVKPSLRFVQENVWALFYLSFLPSILMIVGLVLAGSVPESSTPDVQVNGRAAVGLLIAFAGVIASVVTYPGLILLQTRALKGEHPTASECFKAGLPRVVPFILMSVVQGFAVLFGLLLFIVPGLILIRGFLLAPFYVVEQKLSPIESLKKSFNDSKPHAGWLWGTIGVIIVFAILGSLFQKIPVLGYLISIAAGYIYLYAPALRYGEIAKDIKVKVDAPT